MKRFATRSSVRGPRAGFTLIELAIATSILMIGLVSVLTASSQMHSLGRLNRERTLAQNAVRSMAERMHAASHGFAADPQTWAQNLLGVYGAGGSFGNTFSIQGLTPAQDGAIVGSIELVTSETKTDAELESDVGMPRDLNADGDASDVDVSASARILPVVLTVRWQGENGVHVMRHGFYLLGY